VQLIHNEWLSPKWLAESIAHRALVLSGYHGKTQSGYCKYTTANIKIVWKEEHVYKPVARLLNRARSVRPERITP